MLSKFAQKLEYELNKPQDPIEQHQRNRVMLDCVELGLGYSFFFLVGCVALYGYVPTYMLVIAGAITMAEAYIKVGAVNRFRKQSAQERSNPTWRRTIWLGGLHTGIFFGLAALTLLLPLPRPNLMLLFAAFLGVYIVSCWLGSVYIATGYAKLIPLTLPLAIAMALQGTFVYILLSLALLVSTGLSLFYIRGLVKQSGELVSARLRIEELYQKLSVEKKNSDQAVIDKSRFIAAASHDLRQPLHALGLFLGAIRSRIEDKKIVSLMDSVDKSTDALNHLFDGLLDVSKLDAGAIEPKLRHFYIDSLFATMDDEFNQLARSHGLELGIHIDQCVVRTDFLLLERVTRNLLSNAIDNTEQGSVSVVTKREGEEVILTISDTGIGIPETELDDIFNEFHQIDQDNRHEKNGFGLGLSIVKRISDLLEFDINLRSTVGKGTQVELRLPKGDPDLVAHRADSIVEGSVRPGTRILFIDDNRSILEGMQYALDDWDVECLLTTSYDDAVRTMEKLKFFPDLIISDYHLAGNASGVSAVMQIREKLREDIPYIVITADTSGELLKSETTPIPPILYKPVRPDKLREAIMLHTH